MRHRGSILRQVAPKEAPRGTVQRKGVRRSRASRVPDHVPGGTAARDRYDSWSRRPQPIEIHSILPSPSGRGHICAPTSDNAGVRLTAASDHLPRAAPEQEVACSSPAGTLWKLRPGRAERPCYANAARFSAPPGPSAPEPVHLPRMLPRCTLPGNPRAGLSSRARKAYDLFPKQLGATGGARGGR